MPERAAARRVMPECGACGAAKTFSSCAVQTPANRKDIAVVCSANAAPAVCPACSVSLHHIIRSLCPLLPLFVVPDGSPIRMLAGETTERSVYASIWLAALMASFLSFLFS
jgi:hypothetical protein